MRNVHYSIFIHVHCTFSIQEHIYIMYIHRMGLGYLIIGSSQSLAYKRLLYHSITAKTTNYIGNNKSHIIISSLNNIFKIISACIERD